MAPDADADAAGVVGVLLLLLLLPPALLQCWAALPPRLPMQALAPAAASTSCWLLLLL